LLFLFNQFSGNRPWLKNSNLTRPQKPGRSSQIRPPELAKNKGVAKYLIIPLKITSQSVKAIFIDLQTIKWYDFSYLKRSIIRQFRLGRFFPLQDLKRPAGARKGQVA
jgi:hypothetical protein